MARSAGDVWSLYDLLQSLRSLGTGRRLGPDHGCIGCNEGHIAPALVWDNPSSSRSPVFAASPIGRSSYPSAAAAAARRRSISASVISASDGATDSAFRLTRGSISLATCARIFLAVLKSPLSIASDAIVSSQRTRTILLAAPISALPRVIASRVAKNSVFHRSAQRLPS